MHQCLIISSKRTRQQDPEPALWINSYEGLPNLLECNSLYVYGNIWTDSVLCTEFTMPALCEVPIDPVVTVSSTITETETTSEDVTSILTTVFYSTETVTDYFVTRITTVITQGTSTLTTITT